VAVALFAVSEARAQRAADRAIVGALAVGPSSCIDRETLARGISTWLGRPTIDGRIAIAVREGPDGVIYSVTRDGARIGERTMHVVGASCADVHAAVSLGIAIAIDATLLESLGIAPAPSSPTSATRTAPNDAAAPRGFVAAQPPRLRADLPVMHEEKRDHVIAAGAQGLVLVGVLPKVTLGVAPFVDVTLIRAFDLRASGLVSTTADVAVREGSASVGLVAGRLDACAALRAGAARLRGCVGAAAGAVSAEGTGYPDSYSTTAAWIGPAVRFDGRWSFGSVFGLVLSLDGFIPGVKPRLDVLAPDGSVSESRTFPLAGVVLGLGPSISFW
jgi:hypothetical protein